MATDQSQPGLPPDPYEGPHPPHMSPAEFRALGRRMVDWIADYMETVQDRRVYPDVQPGDIAAAMPKTFPTAPGGPGEWDAIIADLDRFVVPGLTHWQHPGFFGYFPANNSWPAVLGELACAGLGVNGFLWATSPAITEVETRVLDWAADLFALGDRFRSDGPTHGGGVIQGTASESTLLAMLAGRHRLRRALGHSAARHARVIASRQAHSSVLKAAMIAGLADGPDDAEHVRLIPTNPAGEIDTHALAAELDRPDAPPVACVVATMGTTSSGAIDPIHRFADLIAHAARPAGPLPVAPWLHVDAAYSGAALVCPEHRWTARGLDRADSICINPHKWLLTTFDCDLFWVADRADLNAALSVSPEYLRNAASDAGSVIDYRDWQVPLGRRFRALKLWFVIRHYGAQGLMAHIRRHVAWAAWFEARVREHPALELIAPRHDGLVCFAHRFGNDRTRSLLTDINAQGSVYLTHTTLPDARGADRFVVRLAVGPTLCRFEDIRRAWAIVDRCAGYAGS